MEWVHTSLVIMPLFILSMYFLTMGYCRNLIEKETFKYRNRNRKIQLHYHMQYFIVFESRHSIWFDQLLIISFIRFNITVFVNSLLYSCHLLSFLSLFLCLSEKKDERKNISITGSFSATFSAFKAASLQLVQNYVWSLYYNIHPMTLWFQEQFADDNILFSFK